MKNYNKTPLVLLFITLLLNGCMPDSLTKFKKDPPKKEAVTTSSGGDTTGPVVDDSGAVVPFIEPTYFFMGVEDQKYAFAVSSAISNPITTTIDGSVGDGATNAFKLGCSLVTTGVNSQASVLPAGLSINSSSCSISGTPSANKSVITPFCSDSSLTNQTDCESTALTWNASTGCSNNDFRYNTQAKCIAANNRWYDIGSAIPYKIELRYQNSDGVLYRIYSTAEIGTYTTLTSLKYTQSDKLLFSVTSTPTVLSAIAPVRTTSTMSGAYPSANILAANNGALGVINYVDKSQSLIGVKKLIKMTLANASAFSAGGFLISSTGKIGKIFKKDSSNTNIIYVENISGDEKYFSASESLDPGTSYVAPATTTISSIDETLVYDLASAPKLDNDRSYYSTKATMSAIPANSYLVNSINSIKPLRPTKSLLNSSAVNDNGIVVTVSPKLPAGLTLDPVSGYISGSFLKPMTATDYVVTATNPLGSVTATIKLVAIDAPADLSLSTKQIITLSNTAFFIEGEKLFQQITPPLSTAPTGKILKILNDYQMAVDTTDGAFLENASLDSGSGFFSEKAYIIPDKSCVNTNYDNQVDCESDPSGYSWSSGPVYYNLSLKLSGTSTDFNTGSCSDSDPYYSTQELCEELHVWNSGDSTCSRAVFDGDQVACEASRVWGPGYVTSTGGAKGIVAGIFKAANDILFVRHITQSASSVTSAKTFNQGDALASSALTVDEVDYNFMNLTLNSAAGFTAGKDVTSKVTAGNIQAGGYIYAIGTGNHIFVSDITKAPGSTLFKINDEIYNSEFASGTQTVIDAVTHDILLVAERGNKITINTSISAGSAIYTITPSLPVGLSLDTLTGVISGTPTTITPKKDFILTATNFIGQATYVFSMEVRDYFTILDASGAPSFLLHKVGDTQVDRKCRVNAADIINNVGALDIRCNFEAEEEDLYFNPIKLTATAGPGVCQYVQYSPYYFWQYSPIQTAGTGTKYPSATTIYTGCDAGGILPTVDLCDGNYTDGPSCDEGTLSYNIQDRTGTTGACVNNGALQPRTVSCGGKKVNCIAGPINDLLSSSQLDSGFRSMIYQTPNGFNQSWTFSAPIAKEDYGNMRIANSTRNNLCTASNADVNTWSTIAAAASSLTQPFGESSPYYVFNCLNAASQIKARIRLIVRDWDRSFKVNNGIDLLNPLLTTGVATDADGGFMENAGTDQFGESFNNYNDWDNAYNGAAANYSGASCGLRGAGAQYQFPEDNL